MIGVNYELFWTLNPKTLMPFIKAFSMKKEHEDELAWQQGLYIRLAITSSFNKSSKYPEKPIFSGKGKDTEMTPEQKQKQIKERFMNHAMMLNARRK